MTFTKFREYTQHPVTGITSSTPMAISEDFESYLCKDTTKNINNNTVSFAYIDCYNVYYIPVDDQGNPLNPNSLPKVYYKKANDTTETELAFGGFLSDNNVYDKQNTNDLDPTKFYVSRVCTLNPTELISALNSGNYMLSNMPGAIWTNATLAEETQAGVPTTTVRIHGGETFYSTIALSAYIKYIAKYYGTASYTPQGDCIPKYSLDVQNNRIGIIQSSVDTNWTSRAQHLDDVLTVRDLDLGKTESVNSIPVYDNNSRLLSSAGTQGDEVLNYGQTSDTASPNKVARFNSEGTGIDTNVSSADKVNHSLSVNDASLSLVLSFDGSSDQVLRLTKGLVGLGEVENYSIRDIPLFNGTGQGGNRELIQYFRQKSMIPETATTPEQQNLYKSRALISNSEGEIDVLQSVSVSQLRMLESLDPTQENIIVSSMKNVPNGVCGLDEEGKVPLAQLNLQTTKLMGEFYLQQIDPQDESQGYGAYIDVEEGGLTVIRRLYNQLGLQTKPDWIENGYTYICEPNQTTPKPVVGIGTNPILMESGDKLYALLSEGETAGTWDLKWSFQRDSDLVSSVAGRVGAVVLEAADIQKSFDSSIPNYQGTLDIAWFDHTYQSVQTDIDSKLVHLQTNHPSIVMVTDANSEIVPSSVTVAQLGLLTKIQNPNNDAFVAESEVSDSYTSNDAKIVKTKSTGRINPGFFMPSQFSGILIFDNCTVTWNNNDMAISIDSTSLSSQLDGNTLSTTSRLFFLPTGEDWLKLTLGCNLQYTISSSGDISIGGSSTDANLHNITSVNVAMIYRYM